VADAACALGPPLVRLAAVLVVVHGAALLLFESQTTIALSSDPFGWGWDLLGTSSWRTNYRLVSPSVLLWAQVIVAAGAHAAAFRSAGRRLAVGSVATRIVARRDLVPLAAVLALAAAGNVALLVT